MIARDYQLLYRAQNELLNARKEIRWLKAGVVSSLDTATGHIDKAMEYLQELDIVGGGSSE